MPCDGIISTAEHVTTLGAWVVLPSFLSSPTIFLFWSIEEEDEQYYILLRIDVLATVYEIEMYFCSSFSLPTQKSL